MFYRSHSRRPTFDQRNIPQYFSYKEIFRTLYHNIKNTISKFWSLDYPQCFQWRRMSQQIFFTTICSEMQWNNSRNRISTTIHIFLGRKKEKTGGNPSASNISLCISLLLVISVETILWDISVWSFLTPDTLVFLRK